MVKDHLKRIAAPRTWKIERKKTTFIAKPNPGAHKFEHCMALSVIMTEMIKVVKLRKEVNYALHKKEVLVDGKRRREKKLPVGLMDVITFPELNQSYRMIIDKKGKIKAIPIKGEETSLKICRIENKQLIRLKGKKQETKIQISLHDGRNILLDTKQKNEYKTGDTLLLKLPEQKVIKHIKLEKNALVFLMGGKHIGAIGVVEDLTSDRIFFRTETNEKYETARKYAFVIGQKEPLITVTEQIINK